MMFCLLISALFIGIEGSGSPSHRFLRRQSNFFLRYAQAELGHFEGREATLSALSNILHDIVNTPRAVSQQYLLARVLFNGPEDPSERGPMHEYLHQGPNGEGSSRKFGIDMLTIANVNIMEYEGLVRDNTLRQNLSRFFGLVSQLGISTREIEHLYATLPLDDITCLGEMIDQMELSISGFIDNKADKSSIINVYGRFGVSSLREDPKIKSKINELDEHPSFSRGYVLGQRLRETTLLNNRAFQWLLTDGGKLHKLTNRIYDTLIEVTMESDEFSQSQSILAGRESDELLARFQWRRKWVDRIRARLYLDGGRRGLILYLKLENFVNYIFIHQEHGDWKQGSLINPNFKPNPSFPVNIEAVETLLEYTLGSTEDRISYSLSSLSDAIDLIQSDINLYSLSPSAIIRVAYELARRFGLQSARPLLAHLRCSKSKAENLETILAALLIFGKEHVRDSDLFFNLARADENRLGMAARFMSYLVNLRLKNQSNELDEAAPLFEPGVWLLHFLPSYPIVDLRPYSQYILEIYQIKKSVEIDSRRFPIYAGMTLRYFIGFPTELHSLSKRASDLFFNHWFKPSLNRDLLWMMFQTARHLPSNLIISKFSRKLSDADFDLLERAAASFLQLLELFVENIQWTRCPKSWECLEKFRFVLNTLNSCQMTSISELLEKAGSLMSAFTAGDEASL